MRKIIVDKKYNDKKLNSVLLDIFKNLNINILFKALRQKDIKINGNRVKENLIVYENDVIEVFISDELLFGNEIIDFNIAYEDKNILVIDKPQGISVTEESGKSGSSSITLTKLVKEKFGSDLEPCHRLDRNTSGIVLFAKNKESLKILFEKFKSHEIEKHYKAMVYGIPKEEHKILKDYLFKDSKKNIVYVSNIPKKGYLEIITEYTIIEKNIKNNTAILDINLHTGRTHQIRAHLSFFGYPIIGDGKYGNSEINKKFGKKFQELRSYKIKFRFNGNNSILEYLNGVEISV
ncbi:MAG: RluA family pseudouridine synthase [Clostridia bacterium]|nr:RluA family pseudouridine synthase [Clostridia bacterium]